ncbi:hypothetical protein [Corallococcus exiguus]|uniref:Uncharacterized protein n=1 Tax=Corallococcus exiguus TaxID=83462 RepID=A0A7X5BPX2_9BACT|nr:hypothetical protein [Corallococcus exiguus]NBC41206.1 hypothetical protein [Corallococcus exiguus]TNV48811.1 hypothetical protein FH620_40910 [Corallococcus exiguus]
MNPMRLRDGEFVGHTWARITLKVKPLDVLLGPRTKAADQQLKSYYCLQRAVGNIPPEAVTAHAAFFEWLDCGP